MLLHIVARGKIGRSSEAELVERYAKRISWPVRMTELPETGGKMPAEAHMWPAQMPYQPSVAALHNNGRHFPPNYLHDSWMDYLYWDTELDP